MKNLFYSKIQKERLSYSSKDKTKDHLTLEDIYNQYDLIYYILNIFKPYIYKHWIVSSLSLTLFSQILHNGKTILLVLAFLILGI